MQLIKDGQVAESMEKKLAKERKELESLTVSVIDKNNELQKLQEKINAVVSKPAPQKFAPQANKAFDVDLLRSQLKGEEESLATEPPQQDELELVAEIEQEKKELEGLADQ